MQVSAWGDRGISFREYTQRFVKIKVKSGSAGRLELTAVFLHPAGEIRWVDNF